MKQNHIAKSLLAGTGVSENDAARLTLEAIETMGELATGASRPELVTLLRPEANSLGGILSRKVVFCALFTVQPES